MRISVFCGATYMSGAELITLAMMRGLKARGHDLRCVVSGWNDGEFIRELRKSGIEHDEIFLGKIGMSLSPRRLLWSADALVHLPGALRAARHHLERFQPDVVVATNRDSTFWLRRSLKRRRTVLYVHELADSSRIARWTYAMIDRCIMRYVAISLSIQTRLVALGIDPARIDLIYNGVPVPDIEPRPRNEEGAAVRIGIVGQIGEWKGHDELLKALVELNTRGHDFECHVFGRGDPAYVRELQTRADAHGLAPVMRWHGFVHDRERIFNGLDIVVMPSQFDEPLGVTAIEAAMWALPVIATRKGGLPEVVVEGETGFCVAEKDAHALADRLEQLIADGTLRREMGNAARRRALMLFREARMIDSVELLCADLTRAGTIPGPNGPRVTHRSAGRSIAP